MPKIQRQSPPAPVKAPLRAPSNNGQGSSILDEAIPVSELGSTWHKVTIYGKNRVGKTTLGCMFPKPLLLVSFEPDSAGGADSVKKIDGVHLLRIKTAEKARELVDALQGKNPYATCVIDTATSLQEVCLEEVIGGPVPVQMRVPRSKEEAASGITREDYFRRSEKTKEILKGLLELPQHTVVLSQEADSNKYKEDLPAFWNVALGDSPARWLYDKSSWYFQLSIALTTIKVDKELIHQGKKIKQSEDKEVYVRRLRVLPHENYAAGIRFNYKDVDSLPEFIETRKAEEMYQKMMELMEG